MNRKTGALAAAFALLAVVFSPAAWSDFALNMPRGVTTISPEVYRLHMQILWVCVVIGVGVFTAMVIAIVRFRKSKNANPAKFSHNTIAEITWTSIPAVILVVMAIPAAGECDPEERAMLRESTGSITGAVR